MASPRIVSLLPSATEVVCALGLGDCLIGRSHECDYPPEVVSLPVCSEPKIDVHGSSANIHREVEGLLRNALSVYDVKTEVLRSLNPTHIVTQDQCEVCAVSVKDLSGCLAEYLVEARLVSLSPNSLDEVFASFRQAADGLGVASHGERLVTGIQTEIEHISLTAAAQPKQPTVACIEWIDPLMAAGNWVPELVSMAGGRNLIGEAGRHSPWMEWSSLVTADPEIIIVMPCGFDLIRTMDEARFLIEKPEWSGLRAVRANRVYAVDGHQYFNRPGPRLLDSLEMLAEMIHPEMFPANTNSERWREITS